MIKDWTVVDPAGEVVAALRGEPGCAAGYTNDRPDFQVLELFCPDPNTHKVVNGALVPRPTKARGPSYAQKRRAKYPAGDDQLDMLWRGIFALAARQPLPQEVTAMFEAINAVKAEIPKPDAKEQ